jgi:hypothetical protein
VTTRKWRCRPAAAALALAAALAGCGVPSESGIVVEGPGQQAAPAFGDESPSEPLGRAETNDAVDFVTNYLAAVAGDPKRAVERARAFFAPDRRAGWTPEPAVTVIRVQDDPQWLGTTGEGEEVSVTATELGRLGDDGMFVPRAAKTVRYEFTVGSAEREAGLFMRAAPTALLLSDEALRNYFELRTIYFWSVDHQVLVPDLRYLPRRDVPAAQSPTLIIDWLLRGPSPWLEGAVERLPEDASRQGKVPVSDDGVVSVELSKAADLGDAGAVDRLATQLRWSLRTGSANRVLELRVDTFKRTFDDADYLKANPAYRAGAERPRFCLVGGQVRRLESTQGGGPPAPAPVVPETANRQVVRAALAVVGGQNLVALFRAGRDNRVALDLGAAPGLVSGVVRTKLTARSPASVGQPVWLPGSRDTGLVVVDSKLLRFQAGKTAVTGVEGAPDEVSAFAIPPDGRRIAYVSGGRLWVAPLLRSDGRLAVGDGVQMPTTMADLTAVGWSQQDWLVVAGRDAVGYGFEDISVDGAVRGLPRNASLTGPVTHMVASTDDPFDAAGVGQVLYEGLGDRAYEIFGEAVRLDPAQVEGAPASPLAPGGVPDYPKSPFYLE